MAILDESRQSSSDRTKSSVTVSSLQNDTDVNKLFLLPLSKETAEIPPGIIGGTFDDESSKKIIPETEHVPGLPRYRRTSGRRSSVDYQEIIRSHFMKPILQSLQKVQLHAKTPNASVYINQLLHNIANLDKYSPNDPILEVLLALYDALAFEGLWATYTSDQYAKAEQILTRTLKLSLNTENLEKAIMGLDEAGFNILPIPFLNEEL